MFAWHYLYISLKYFNQNTRFQQLLSSVFWLTINQIIINTVSIKWKHTAYSIKSQLCFNKRHFFFAISCFDISAIIGVLFRLLSCVEYIYITLTIHDIIIHIPYHSPGRPITCILLCTRKEQCIYRLLLALVLSSQNEW